MFSLRVMNCFSRFSAYAGLAPASLLAITVAAAAPAPPNPARPNPASPAAPSAPRNADNPATPPLAAPLPQVLDIKAEVSKGLALLAARDTRAVDVLSRAAQNASAQLSAAMGDAILIAPPDRMPRDGYVGTLAANDALAHYWWGVACDEFGRRAEAVTALTRAVRFAGPQSPGNTVARDAQLRLSDVLRQGLPPIVPDDVFETVAQTVYGGRWTPRRFRVSLPDSPGSGSFTEDFLATDGALFPPALTSHADPTAGYTRVPPLYANVPDDKLPPVLNLDRMAVGFARETSGPDRGLWRQVVQVFYASTYRTKDGRDDRPRAQALCEQFLKVRALFLRTLGLQNGYSRDGITKIYLSELSALWPDDEEDPAIRALLGPKMPPPNTPLRPGETPATEPQVQTSPFSRPWVPSIAAAQVDSAPGEIIFFKVGQTRAESEWLRELAHEYSHVVVPPFGGFRPPNEPYANGTLGETLAMIWVAQQPDAFTVQAPASGGALPVSTDTTMPMTVNLPEVRTQVGQNGVAALRFWNARGPFSKAVRDPSPEGWRYLQGLAVYLERVYGSQLTGQALRRLQSPATSSVPTSASASRSLSAADLLDALPVVWRDPFAGIGNSEAAARAIPIWLPGALDGVVTRADDLVARAPATLQSGVRVGAWLWVPPTATKLRIEWRGSGKLRVEGMVGMPVPPLTSGASSEAALTVNVTGRSGWQRLVCVPGGEVQITRAQFERG